MEESQYISSKLYKSYLLVTQSTLFPELVRAAAWATGTPYSETLLYHVASNEVILGALQLQMGEGMDATIANFIVEAGEDVDLAIIAAVQNFNPEQPE